jgi:hypothetical protein
LGKRSKFDLMCENFRNGPSNPALPEKNCDAISVPCQGHCSGISRNTCRKWVRTYPMHRNGQCNRDRGTGFCPGNPSHPIPHAGSHRTHPKMRAAVLRLLPSMTNRLMNALLGP